MTTRKCKVCSNEITGRTDKLFCSTKCKNYYHLNLRKATKQATEQIDKILHRNRSILLELMGKNKTQIKIKRIVLEKKKFNYLYHTHLHVNSHGKTFYYVYDFAWMSFSDDEILIRRVRQTN